MRAFAGNGPSVVIAGLDPAIHPLRRGSFSMDARVTLRMTRRGC
jgi:hypothetical protein